VCERFPVIFNIAKSMPAFVIPRRFHPTDDIFRWPDNIPPTVFFSVHELSYAN